MGRPQSSNSSSAAAAASSSCFTTPNNKTALRVKERQDRLLQQGILSSPFSSVRVQHSGSSNRKSSANKNANSNTDNNNNKSHQRNSSINNSINQINKKKKDVVIFHLIRHGQSVGQTVDRQRRMNDTNLLDCGLSKLGVEQARAIQLPSSVQLIVSSPLTRAVATACLAAAAASNQSPPTTTHDDQGTTTTTTTSGGKQQKRLLPILIHYHLRELGSMIPENIPRRIKDVQNDLARSYGMVLLRKKDDNNDTMMVEDTSSNTGIVIDWDTLLPNDWPYRHDECPKSIRRDRVRDALYWLAIHRPEREMAVFCHFHVIQSVVLHHNGNGGVQCRVDNATIITCEMCRETGEIRLLLTTDPQQERNHPTRYEDDHPMETG
jgi:phosphohistidine phosphatase SixA